MASAKRAAGTAVPKVTETQLMMAVRDALLRTGRVLLWRNNTGQLKDQRGRWVSFGLGLGSPDLVGIFKDTGQLIGVEVKTAAGRMSPEQKAWHQAAASAGAIVGCARSVAEAMALLPRAATQGRDA